MPDKPKQVIIRDAADSDAQALQTVYAHHVLYGLATFEEDVPAVEDMRSRWLGIREAGFPYLVAELDGLVVGYCYASHYRTRSAYRFAIEDSVYVREGFAGRGVGTALMAELLRLCDKGPWQQMLAVIGDSANLASVNLHRKFGFHHVGCFTRVGYKLGQWVDTVLMQRALGNSSQS